MLVIKGGRNVRLRLWRRAQKWAFMEQGIGRRSVPQVMAIVLFRTTILGTSFAKETPDCI